MSRKQKDNITLMNIKQKKDSLKNIKFQQINLNNLLEITPNDLYNCFNNNKTRIEKEAEKLHSEISDLLESYKITNDKYKKVQIKNQINERKNLIDALNTSFKKWGSDIYKNINVTMKHIFKNSIPRATEKDLNSIISQLGNMMTDSKYFDSSFRDIIITFIKNHKNNPNRLPHENPYFQPTELLDYNTSKTHEFNEVAFPFNNENDLISYEEKQPTYKNNTNIERQTPVINPSQIQSYSNKNPMNNAKISVFYGSFEFPSNGKNGPSSSLERMLLGSLNLMSKFLYGTVQKQISKLYEELDEDDESTW